MIIAQRDEASVPTLSLGTHGGLEGGASPLNFVENVLGCGGPNEGFGMFVMIGEIPVDGDLQIGDAPEYPSTNPLMSDLREKAFHKVQPGAGCRSKMKVEAWVTLQPCLHFWMLMGRIIVSDQVQIEVFRCASINFAQELDEFLMPVPVHALADHGCRPGR